MCCDVGVPHRFPTSVPRNDRPRNAGSPKGLVVRVRVVGRKAVKPTNGGSMLARQRPSPLERSPNARSLSDVDGKAANEIQHKPVRRQKLGDSPFWLLNRVMLLASLCGVIFYVCWMMRGGDAARVAFQKEQSPQATWYHLCR